MKPIVAAICLVILLPEQLPGQSKTPAFEVADVHVSPPGTRQGDGGFMPGGRIELHGATMLDLIGLRDDREEGDQTAAGGYRRAARHVPRGGRPGDQ
jgi:hypothetical protein